MIIMWSKHVNLHVNKSAQSCRERGLQWPMGAFIWIITFRLMMFVMISYFTITSSTPMTIFLYFDSKKLRMLSKKLVGYYFLSITLI